MIQELIDLKQSIIEGRTDDALAIVDELNEMGKKSILRNIKSYLVRLLIHLIKNEVEQRLTNSWAASIGYSVVEIQDLNLMENKTSYYLKIDEWDSYLENSWKTAILKASEEVMGGKYQPRQLTNMADKTTIFNRTMQLLQLTYHCSEDTLLDGVYEEFRQLPGGEDWNVARED